MKQVIYVVAPTSSGKTTSATNLSKEIGLPLIHADSAYHIIRDQLEISGDAGRLTDYRLWNSPKSFGLESWAGHAHLDALKPGAYKKLLEGVNGDFIIEGFTLSFISERNIINELVGDHKSIIVRIRTSFQQWTEFYIKRNKDVSVINRRKDFERLTNCFEPDSKSSIFTVSHPAEVTEKLILGDKKGSDMKNVFLVSGTSFPSSYGLSASQDNFSLVGKNSGNLAFFSAINNHLGTSDAIAKWKMSSAEINSFGNVGVIPAANNFGAHSDYSGLAQKFSELECKLVMIGLGAQSNIDGRIPEVPEGTIRWIKEIAARRPNPSAPNISVRGPISQKILDHYGFEGQTVVLGCPSLFTNPDPVLGQKIAANVRPIKRVAVPAGHERWRHLARLETSLTRIVTATGGSYVGQSALNMFRLTRGEARLMDEADLRACRDYACPEMDLEEFTRWSERHGNLFFDVQSWMEHYLRFDFVIGARIHGVMLALQAGIPGVVVAHDSRTLELCQTMMVPYVLAKDVQQGITREQLPDLFKFDAKAFDENRRVLAKRYVEFLESNELTPVNWLKGLAA